MLQVNPSLHCHAGVWLREEIVKPYGLSVSEAARRLGVARPTMSKLFNGNASLSAEMALRFEKAFGISADTLMRMQATYDMAQAREHADALAIERVPEPAEVRR
ncbi:hypothetical protein GCM10011371_08480 [Novosphingobium marinum]|uniref:Addiction module HigA family antidote n=1 Tax=Novosphingobium marinum TaxID=1514948 RepID=A0A7Z0BUQ1_9SPHN|nr:HigA family addiction module antitoxin [Novosphingobium marinum]NYH94535.1 addiction module HigA family antidote [Novosphingobium marinum]GGC23073.1 hypothetical protein GCM10011371_08480 [Novosphingobium marinum]